MERRRYGQTSVDLRRVAGLQQVVAEQHATHRVSDGQHHAALEATAHCRHYLRCMHVRITYAHICSVQETVDDEAEARLNSQIAHFTDSLSGVASLVKPDTVYTLYNE